MHIHIMSDANENSRFTALKQLFPTAEYSILKQNFILRCQIDVSAKRELWKTNRCTIDIIANRIS
jgi:hypothetical protein